MYLVFEKTNILKLLNSHVNLSTSFNAMKRIMCDLCVSYAFFIGTFFTQDCEKKLIVRKNGLKKTCPCMLVMVQELVADIGRSVITKYDILLGGCLCCTFSNS